MTSQDELRPGQIRLRNVSRSFNVLHERNATLKDAILRRRRTSATQLWALRDVDLDVRPGESVGLIGRNGTGKSTLLKLVAGILAPQAGTVEAGGKVASMLELGAGFHPDFTGRENVYLTGSIYGLSEAAVDERLDEIVEFGELVDFIDMPVRTYSSGMYMRLGFSIASHVSPDILLLDEVLAVGDEAFQHKCAGRIQQYHRDGGTLLYVSHDPASVARTCERAILLLDGRVVADGPPVEVLADYHRLLAGQAGTPRDVRAATGSRADERAWGTGQLTIDDVSLLGDSATTTDRFLAGESFEIRLQVTAHEPLADVAFGLAVHSASGVQCFGTNTRIEQFEVPTLDGCATVAFRVPALHLHEGQFVVSVAAHSGDETVIYHWRDRCTGFTVFPANTGVGLVDAAGEWAVETTSTPLAEHHSADTRPDHAA